MSELERYVTPSHEYDPRRKLLQLKELGAGNNVLMARKDEVRRLCPCCDVDVLGLKDVVSDLDRRRTCEMGSPVIHLDTHLAVPFLITFGNRVSERALKSH